MLLICVIIVWEYSCLLIRNLWSCSCVISFSALGTVDWNIRPIVLLSASVSLFPVENWSQCSWNPGSSGNKVFAIQRVICLLNLISWAMLYFEGIHTALFWSINMLIIWVSLILKIDWLHILFCNIAEQQSYAFCPFFIEWLASEYLTGMIALVPHEGIFLQESCEYHWSIRTYFRTLSCMTWNYVMVIIPLLQMQEVSRYI